MEAFLNRHADAVIGALSGFDRLVFRGTLRVLAHHLGMQAYLWAVQVLLKDFASHAEAVTRELREASEELARRTGRPIRFLPSSATNKEAIARAIARQDGIEQGLICIITAVEPCLSYDIVRDRQSRRLRLLPRHRKCLHLYHYQMHPLFGFMHARIQTWFPFAIQICLNGREWLARTLDAAGSAYVRRDNCFTWLQDPAQAQRLMNRQVRAAWPDLLNGIARSLNPRHAAMFQAFPVNYYWSTHQSEWATDILFRTSASLARLYPRLVQHGLTTFLSPDVMRFLGRTIPPSGTLPPHLLAEVVSDVKRSGGRRGCGSSIGSGRTRSRCMTSKAACYASRPRSTTRRGSRPIVPRRANRRRRWVGTPCARGLPTCTGARKSLRPPTTATCGRWPPSRTPHPSAS